jgi:hypothetical protein
MEEKKKRGKAGRPSLKDSIDPEMIEKLAKVHCSPQEMGFILGIDFRTIVKHYGDIIEKGKAMGKLSLRRKQMEVAMTGNPTMLIWLGKNWLGQEDNPKSEDTAKVLPWNDDIEI